MNDLASALLICLEGLKLTSYKDTGGVWTIGIGHTKGVSEGQQCTVDQVMQWLEEDAAPLYLITRNMPELEAAAYISFGYNCGIGNLTRVLQGTGKVSDPVHTTDRHGVIQSGLVARRNLELTLLNMVHS